MMPAFNMLLGFVCFFILLLNIVSLPANWIIVFFFILLSFLPGFILSFQNILVLLSIALVAELLEGGVQILLSKRSGASVAGNWAGIFGSIIGAILGIPFLLGFGALLGALLGAWISCYLVERLSGKSSALAQQAAFGSMKGKLIGFCIKMALGVYLTVYGLQHLSFSLGFAF